MKHGQLGSVALTERGNIRKCPGPHWIRRRRISGSDRIISRLYRGDSGTRVTLTNSVLSCCSLANVRNRQIRTNGLNTQRLLQQVHIVTYRHISCLVWDESNNILQQLYLQVYRYEYECVFIELYQLGVLIKQFFNILPNKNVRRNQYCVP